MRATSDPSSTQSERRVPVAILLPPFLIAAAFFAVIGASRTIAPLDQYLVTPELYQPGNALKIHNGYTTDFTQVYVPWKYYISQFHPSACQASIANGIRLPQSTCYPFSAVRRYTADDLFFPLAHVFSFFTAYDLSYLLFLIFCYSAFLTFFSAYLPESTWIIRIALAAAATTSFPMARDLQADGLSRIIPWFLLSLAALKLRKGGRLRWFLSAFLLTIAIIGTSLQALAFVPLFWVLYLFMWEKPLRSPLSFLGCLALAMAGGLLWHYPAIELFLADTRRFVPTVRGSAWVFSMKRIAALGFSFANFLSGDLLMSFTTIDFSKVLGSLGARDYPSYDYASYFIQPAASGYFLVYFVHQLRTRKWDRRLGLIGGIFLADLIVALLPTYRLVYFRFHQWWLLVNLSLVLGLLIGDGAHRRWKKIDFALAAGLGLSVLGSLFVFTRVREAWLLGHLGTNGYLGFEAGFWQARVHRLWTRLTFRDPYSVLFLLSLFASVTFYYVNARKSFVLTVTASGLALNLFFVNLPQPRNLFYRYQDALRAEPASNPVHSGEKVMGRLQPQNTQLLVDRPVEILYESLEVPGMGNR